MPDIKHPTALWLKAGLFLLIAVTAAVLLVLERPTLRVGILLALTVWASCRAYYFAFYVIEHYVDPGFRFSGLGSFVVYALRKRSNPEP